MKKQSTKSPLKLNTEVVRKLHDQQLETVQGGAFSTRVIITCGCPPLSWH